jgi:hypothetical protein
MHERKWWPLRATLAWVVSRDDEFTREIHEEKTFTRKSRLCHLKDSSLFLYLWSKMKC